MSTKEDIKYIKKNGFKSFKPERHSYVDENGIQTNYVTTSNPVYINKAAFGKGVEYDGCEGGEQSSKSIVWNVGNLNTDYKYIRPVVVRKLNEEMPKAFRLNDLLYDGTSVFSLDVAYSGLEGAASSAVNEILLDFVSYETSKAIEQVDNILYLGNLTARPDLGYQKYANFIKLKAEYEDIDEFDSQELTFDVLNRSGGQDTPNTTTWHGDPIGTQMSYRHADLASHRRSYMRDEVYAFYIAFIMNDGSLSYGYHIPGRKPTGHELDSASGFTKTAGVDITGGKGKSYQFQNYWDNNGVLSGIGAGSNYTGPLDMAAWENQNEKYQIGVEESEVWDAGTNTRVYTLGSDSSYYDLEGRNVRHHKFPAALDQAQCTSGALPAVSSRGPYAVVQDLHADIASDE